MISESFDKFCRKFVKYQEFYGGFNVGFMDISMGVSFGNLVDGLPGALHTEALWGGQGVFGPAPIDILAKRKIVNILNRKFNFPNVLIKINNVYV